MDIVPLNKRNGDELGHSEDPQIAKLLRRNEKILCSAKVYKYNKRENRQERELLVTSKAIYNISDDSLSGFMSIFCIGSKVKRRIDIKKLTAITISTLSSEFVLHIESEYDYRLASHRRDKILLAICQSFTMNAKNRPLLFYFKDEFNLISYTTTEENKKAGISRMPKGKAQALDANGLRIKLEEARQEYYKNENIFPVFANENHEKVTLDDFEVVNAHRSFFGKTTLVEKKDTKVLYALKTIREDDLGDKDLESLKPSIQKNSCPFLVKIEYIFQTVDKIFLFMEFKKGGDLLYQLKACRRFDEKKAKFYTAEVILALEYLHSLGDVYGDLKPEKVLMDEEGHICLADSGFLRRNYEEEISSINGDDKTVITEPYVDWWALGIFVSEMLMGVSPFSNSEKMRKQKAISVAQKEVNFGNLDISEEAKDFVDQLLKAKPHERLGFKGAYQVKGHKWFSDINWEDLSQKKVAPPFKPELSDDHNVINFDRKFSNEDDKNLYLSESENTSAELTNFTFNPNDDIMRPKTQ